MSKPIIKDITPVIDRKFSIEFTENQLKVLGVMLGGLTPNNTRNEIKRNDWNVQVFGTVIFEELNLYDNILYVLRPVIE